jgi:hypothetical protein
MYVCMYVYVCVYVCYVWITRIVVHKKSTYIPDLVRTCSKQEVELCFVPYIHLCMYVCMYVWMYDMVCRKTTKAWIMLRIPMYACMYVSVYASDVCNAHTCTYVCMYVHKHLLNTICLSTYVRMDIHTCIHTRYNIIHITARFLNTRMNTRVRMNTAFIRVFKKHLSVYSRSIYPCIQEVFIPVFKDKCLP